VTRLVFSVHILAMPNVQCADGLLEVTDVQFNVIGGQEDIRPAHTETLTAVLDFREADDKLRYVKSLEPAKFLSIFALARQVKYKEMVEVCTSFFNHVLQKEKFETIVQYMNLVADFTEDESTSLAAKYDWLNVH
jgi:hypothetical protein